MDFHKKKKTAQYLYRRKFLCLDETSRVACNSVETQTREILLLFGLQWQNPSKRMARVDKL